MFKHFEKFTNKYIHHYISFIILIKYIFLTTLVAFYIASYTDNSHIVIQSLKNAQQQLETIFFILAGSVLFVYFTPGSIFNIQKDGEWLLFLLGLMLVINADWKSFLIDFSII